MTARNPVRSLLERGISAAEPVLRRTVPHVVRPLLPLVARLPRRQPRTLRNGSGDRERVTFLLLNAYGMGGTIRTVFNLAGHLSTRYDVEVVSVKRRKRRPFFPFPPGVTVTPLDDIYARRRYRWKLGRQLMADHPSHLVNVEDRRYPEFSLWSDLLVMNHLRGLTGVLIATRPGLNLIAAQHAPKGLPTIGQEHMNLPSHRPLLRAGIARHYPDLDVLAVLTQNDLKDYSGLLGSGGPRVVHMPNAVPAMRGGRADLTAKMVVAAGRLTRQKGYDRLIPAWAPVARAHPDWTLQIYGEGPERGRLEGLIVEHGVGDSVSLMGRSDRLGDAFAAASVFVLSSRREGLPMVILEAMSKGLPVVSFDCPTGPAEIVSTDHNGVLVPNADIPALTASLLQLIDDEELRSRLSKGAQETATRYGIDVIGAEWEELIEELLHGPLPLGWARSSGQARDRQPSSGR